MKSKSINQIFKDKPELMEEPEVKELIEYTRELEAQVIEDKQAKQFSKEDKLAGLVRDIYSSIKQTFSKDEEAKRFKETPRIDFEEALENLKIYLEDFAENNKFRL